MFVLKEFHFICLCADADIAKNGKLKWITTKLKPPLPKHSKRRTVLLKAEGTRAHFL